MIFVTIERILFWITTIPSKSYFSENIFWEFITTNGLNAFLVILAIVLIIVFNRKLLAPWESFDNGNRIKSLLLVVACILSWEYVLYDFNYYLNQEHYLDRGLLLVFIILLFWRLIFIVPYIIMLFPNTGQFKILPLYSLAVPLLSIRKPLLFMAFYCYKLLRKIFYFKDFLFLSGCLIAAFYFSSGIRKLNFEWLWYDPIVYLLSNSYANGWLNIGNGEWKNIGGHHY